MGVGSFTVKASRIHIRMASHSPPTIMFKLLSSGAAARRGWSLTQALQHVDGLGTLCADGKFSWARLLCCTRYRIADLLYILQTS